MNKELNSWSKYFIFIGLPFPIISFTLGTIIENMIITHLSVFILGLGITGLFWELTNSGILPIRRRNSKQRSKKE